MSLRSASSLSHTEIIPTDSEEEAFRDIDVAFLVGSMPRREGMLRKDLLTANAKIFRSQGKSLDKFAKKTVKVRGQAPIITLVMSWRSTISCISVLFHLYVRVN